jgi:hypothetical protein
VSKPSFGEEPKKSQRDRCLQIAADLKASTKELITPNLVTTACIKNKLFTRAQLTGYRFQGARRQVEQWMKTLDGKGLQTWGQLPLLTADGEMAWELRKDMRLSGYAWNYLLRDDVMARNQIVRDRWREEALERWSAAEFDAEVERLREEREQGAGAA